MQRHHLAPEDLRPGRLAGPLLPQGPALRGVLRPLPGVLDPLPEQGVDVGAGKGLLEDLPDAAGGGGLPQFGAGRVGHQVEDGAGALVRQVPGEVETAHVGQRLIDEDDVGRQVTGPLPPLLAAEGRADEAQVRGGEHAPQLIEPGGVVVHGDHPQAAVYQAARLHGLTSLPP